LSNIKLIRIFYLVLFFFINSQAQSLDQTKISRIDSLYSHKDYQLLLDMADSVLNPESSLDDGAYAATLRFKGRALRKLNMLDSAEQTYLQAISFTSKKSLWEENGRSLRELGLLQKQKALYGQAKQTYNNAIDHLQRAKEFDQKFLALLYNSLAIVCRELAQYDSAAANYFQALLIYEKEADLGGQAQVLNNLGTFQNFQKNYNQALVYFKKSLRIEELRKNNDGVSRVNLNLGNAYFRLKKYDSAQINYMRSLNYAKQQNDIRRVPMLLMNLGSVYQKLTKADSALQMYDNALTIFKKNNNPKGMADINRNIGNVHRHSKAFPESIKYYKNALSIYHKLNLKNDIMSIQFALSDAYYNTNNIKKAYQHYLTYDTLKEDMFNRTKSQQIAELQTKYETEKKEKEIITQKARIQQTTAERNNLYLMLAAVLVLSGLAIAFYIHRSRTMKLVNEKDAQIHHKEVNQLLADQELKAFDAMIEGQEQERKRMAEELHDRLGSTLSATKMHLEALNANSKNNDQVDYINKLLDTAIEDTRQISHNMLSGVLTKFGLVAALHDLKETISSTGQLEISLSTIQVDERLELDTEINLYRITQELLSNTLKHAAASRFSIRLEKKNSTLELTVSDDGKGMGKTQDSSGIGMRNIESRVSKIGGTWVMHSPPGGGFEATISVPV